MVRMFREDAVDFEGIRADLAVLQPRRISEEDVLSRLRKDLIAHRKRGVVLEDLCEALKVRGVAIGVSKLRRFLETGVLEKGGAVEALGGDRAT